MSTPEAEEASVHSASELLTAVVTNECSDLHLNVGTKPIVRRDGRLTSLSEHILRAADTQRIAQEILTERQWKELLEKGEVDLSISLSGVGRYRINAFRQKNGINLAIRVLSSRIPQMDSLGLPPIVHDFIGKHQGLILVTGPTGSGKSTTLAAMVDWINQTQSKHIITLEDPIEYIHSSKCGLIVQREIGRDTDSFSSGLRAALRQDPDVILVGEMRDLETIRTAITAAETGHLVLATLHTPDAPQTVDRVIDAFPTEQQRQIRIQLASVLIGVLSQRLIPRIDRNGRVLAMEIMVNTPAIGNLIRQEKIYQIKSVLQTSRNLGMQTMSSVLKQLAHEGIIHADTWKQYELSTGEAMS
ncbi:type IV pilus twitching motility protein PilT [Gorillibacterium massiliense]|uniref:type IV pilus twitching motility protein PilT n=1 Tax=Gorillibacterium massiliense TaxID=1280390 RepID=UPI0004B701B6|nr:type IV pilus twitching motility protein PilT [Gorillibacterium massiliense]